MAILSNLQTENFSILHGYDGSSFQRHYINRDFGYRYRPFDFFSFSFFPWQLLYFYIYVTSCNDVAAFS